MNTDLRDFLNWFDGFSENIKKQPTSAQWARVKQRFDEMRSAVTAGQVAMPVTIPGGAPGPAPVIPAGPMSPDIAKQLSELKSKGRSASAQGQFTGQAMSAGI